MQPKQRGQHAVTPGGVPIDPRWGGLDPEEDTGNVKMMYHPAYGERYFRNEDVENRESRGWEVVAYTDPTQPTVTTAQSGVTTLKTPRHREEIREATPVKPKTPNLRRRKTK